MVALPVRLGTGGIALVPFALGEDDVAWANATERHGKAPLIVSGTWPVRNSRRDRAVADIVFSDPKWPESDQVDKILLQAALARLNNDLNVVTVRNYISATVPSDGQVNECENQVDHHLVRLSALYKKGSILAAFIALASLVSWAVFATPIISPFISLLIIVFAPFSYLMGKSIEC